MFRHAWRVAAAYSRFRPQLISVTPYSTLLACTSTGYLGSGVGLPKLWSISTQLGTRCLSSSPTKDDTIYALSSAQGRAGIAVIRVSGPACLDVYKAFCPGKAIPRPRYAAARTLFDPERPNAGNILDSQALILHFPGPKTVTGEAVLELHVHGGPATVKAVLSAIPKSTSNGGIRYAEPGEFTKRAFLNDRLDLAQVESLSDSLAAETEQQRRAAVRGNTGVLGRAYEAWREKLLLARGEIEALIDFSEDQHFNESPTELLRNVTSMVREMLRSVDIHEMASQRSELLRNGIRIALLGPPNAGKSSLMNLIVGREASIVSNEAGTTRDIVEVNLDIRGYLCTFADTAGFRSRSSQHPEFLGAVEQEGIRRARSKALESDVVIVLASVEAKSGGGHMIAYDAETLGLAANAQQCLIVVNKRDTVPKPELDRLVKDFVTTAMGPAQALAGAEPLTISCREAEAPLLGLTDAGGIQELIQNLTGSFTAMTSLPEGMEALLGGTERQRQLLALCRQHLEDFLTEADMDGETGEPDVVLAAEHLRYAASCLARITGRGEGGDVEEVLGVIFEKFCVGK